MPQTTGKQVSSTPLTARTTTELALVVHGPALLRLLDLLEEIDRNTRGEKNAKVS